MEADSVASSSVPQDVLGTAEPLAAPTPPPATSSAAPPPHADDAPASSSLLREWAAPNSSEEGNSQLPVAPAVVLNERPTSSEHRASSGSRYNYPVATFVSNFVRTSVNEIRDQIYANAIPASGTSHPHSASSERIRASAEAPGLHGDGAGGDPMSTRSAPAPMIATLSAATLENTRSMNQLITMDSIDLASVPGDNGGHHGESRAMQMLHHDGGEPSAEGNDGADAHSAEFLLIDGDLVAIPAANVTDNDDEGYYSRHRYEQDENERGGEGLPPSCRPRTSRMRRGVKGIKKWIKKIKRKRDKHYQHQAQWHDELRQQQQQHQQQQQQQQQQQMFDSRRRIPTSSVLQDSSYSEALTSASLPESTVITASIQSSHAASEAASASISLAPPAATLLPQHEAGTSGVMQPQPPHPMSERPAESINFEIQSTPEPHEMTGGDQAASPARSAKLPAKREMPKRKKRFSFLRDVESRYDNRKQAPQAASSSSSAAAKPPQEATGNFATGPASVPRNARRFATDSDVVPATAGMAAPRPPSAAATSDNLSTSVLAPAPPPTDVTPPPGRRTLVHEGRASLTLDDTTPAVAALPAASAASLDTSYDPLSFGASAMPSPHAFGLDQTQRVASVVGEASYIGNADQLLEAGVLPETTMAAEAYIEDRMDDYDKYDKKDGYAYYESAIPRDADFKVDKQDAPCVDTMLSRAGEFAEDLEQDAMPAFVEPMPLKAKAKSDGSSVPLSEATSKDIDVHNDTLKLCMVGAPNVNKSDLARAIRGSTKKSKKRKNLGVDVHSWTPPNKQQVQFSIWDVQGASADAIKANGTNFGAHPGTQSVFFSDRSLYLLVWDLAANNHNVARYSHRKHSNDEDSYCSSSSDDDEEEDCDDNEYIIEERNRQADRALRSDIEDRVLSWVDCIARRGPHSAILPIALVPHGMSPQEAKRRCDLMAQLLVDYTQHFESGMPPKVLMGTETLICVSLDTNMGIAMLRETILDIATDPSHSVFDHVGTPVPKGTVHVMEAAQRMKELHKLVLVDHLMAELHTILSVDEVITSLHFLASIGELFYFGADDEDILSRYVILSRKWLVSALSCILRNDLKRELAETRQFMNLQCLYSDQQYAENHITQTFSSNSSNCPLLTSADTQMLWQSMNFMRQAVDRSSELQENATTESTIFGFLERLLVQSGVFLSLDIDDPFQTNDNVYFVPSLLATANGTKEMWTYKSSESWMTTLSHSWLFRDGAPAGLMERITVSLLHDLYEFSRTVSSRPFEQHHHHHHHHHHQDDAHRHQPLNRSNTFPFAQNSFTDFAQSHEGEPIGNIKIHQIMCWKSSIMVKIGCVFPDGDALRESFIEMFITIADQSSPYCVASDIMNPTMQRLIVSGKGQVGHHGIKLWKGGYSIVLDSIKASLAHCTNVDRQVVCPECLAYAHPSGASTWSWDSVRAAATSGSSTIRCMRGHKVDANMVCGTCRPVLSEVHSGVQSSTKRAVRDLLSSVVVVGLWDADTQCFRNVGSGFIVDRRYGLIVTAGHILFNMTAGPDYGTPFMGLQNTKIAIGLIPDGATMDENNGVGNTAMFRYFAEIAADDIHSVDACVLRITTRMESDVASDIQIAMQSEKVVDIQQEELSALKMTRRYEYEEAVRILGFNQGGEGILEQGKHVNRSADFAQGYICKLFRPADDNSNSSDESSSSMGEFSPREEIVTICPTISGHSGGPCVNDEGKVIGILSRADPVERLRCYLVPVSEIKILVSAAKQKLNRASTV